MRDAVEGTSLPRAEGDAMANGYDLFWSWPVPLVTDKIVYKLQDCDGHGTGPACRTCAVTDDFEFKCKAVCVGWTTCFAGAGLCTTVLTKCASGGPYGFASVFAPL